MAEMIAMPTTCKATMALLMDCGHIQFGCGEAPGILMGRLTMIRKDTIVCYPCTGPAGRYVPRRIMHLWEME